MPCLCNKTVCQWKALPSDVREGLLQIIRSFSVAPDGQPQTPEAPSTPLSVLRHPNANTDQSTPVHASSASLDPDRRDVA
jgi:hypothetical protein